MAVYENTYHVAIGPALSRKIPPGDSFWRTFNGAFENQQLTQLNVARRLYDGHSITTCCDPQWRKSENYKLGQHIGLDFDTEDKRSSIPYLVKEPFIQKYGSIVYTTPSHTPDKPRARVIFLLDAPIHQAKNYVLAVSALLWMFGSADRQCKDPVRFFYGGKPGACEMEWLEHELPLALVKDMIRRYQVTGNRERRRSTFQPRDTDQREIVDALKHINPWSISYSEWVSVLMAIHSEMPGPDGESLAEQWADGYKNEVAQKWRSFKDSGNYNGQVTVGTLFALAKANGWQRV
jgi:hypothetical protein